jgi:CYTH domain-containing protein
MTLEIEKKFLIKTLPINIEEYPKEEIIQGYLTINHDGSSARIRQKNNKYFLTIKKGEGLIREEYETEISKEQFTTLWPATNKQNLEKTRYRIPYNNLAIELDIYKNNLKGLYTAEIEYNSETEANDTNIPNWFGKEVTEDLSYSNQSLAIKGSPK